MQLYMCLDRICYLNIHSRWPVGPLLCNLRLSHTSMLLLSLFSCSRPGVLQVLNSHTILNIAYNQNYTCKLTTFICPLIWSGVAMKVPLWSAVKGLSGGVLKYQMGWFSLRRSILFCSALQNTPTLLECSTTPSTSQGPWNLLHLILDLSLLPVTSSQASLQGDASSPLVLVMTMAAMKNSWMTKSLRHLVDWRPLPRAVGILLLTPILNRVIEIHCIRGHILQLIHKIWLY